MRRLLFVCWLVSSVRLPRNMTSREGKEPLLPQDGGKAKVTSGSSKSANLVTNENAPGAPHAAGKEPAQYRFAETNRQSDKQYHACQAKCFSQIWLLISFVPACTAGVYHMHICISVIDRLSENCCSLGSPVRLHSLMRRYVSFGKLVLLPHSAGRLPFRWVSSNSRDNSSGNAPALPHDPGKLPVSGIDCSCSAAREGKAAALAQDAGSVPAPHTRIRIL